jgi:hypothetical protein
VLVRTETGAATSQETRGARALWSVPLVLAAIAVVARFPAFTASRAIVFDDGQYGVSVVDMRRGYAPYSGVFSSQGPLHFPLLYLGDLLGLRTLNAPRVTPLLAGIVATIGVWAIARRLGATQRIAAIAAILVATTGTMIWTTGQVTGDGPAAALVVLALWAALVYRDSPTLARALLVGVAFGAAIAVKPLIATAAIPIAWWMWSGRRRLDHLFLTSGTAIVVWFATALPWGLGRVWDQSVTYHTGKEAEHSRWFNAGKLVTTLVQRDGVLLLALAMGLVAAMFGVSRVKTRDRDALVLAIWTVVVALALVFETALFTNHLATIVIPLALLFAVRPPPLRWLAIGLVVFVPLGIVSVRNMLEPRAYSGIDKELVDILETLPSDTKAISDDPAFVWRAGLYTPRMMNDISKMRIDQGILTTADVLEAARDEQNCVVVIWTERFGQLLPGLRDGLREIGYNREFEFAPNRELWRLTGTPACGIS